MVERGKVHKIEDSYAVVRVSRKSSCDKCGMCAFSSNDTHVDITVKNTVSAEEGDTVDVEIVGGAVLKTTLIVYLMPLMLGLAGLLASFLFSWPEPVALLVFCGLLVAGYLVVYYIDKFVGKRKKLMPKIVKLIKKEQKS